MKFDLGSINWMTVLVAVVLAVIVVKVWRWYMSTVTKVVIYLILGAILLDILTHAEGFSKAVGATGNVFNTSLRVISGQG